MEVDTNEVDFLCKKGWSKYKIAKECGVSWNTVHFWQKRIFNPSQKHKERLDEIIKKEF